MIDSRIAAARSFLFVPGDRPTRFASAAAARPDVVVIDLEDAVAPAAKDAARSEASRAVVTGIGDGQAFMVRVNALDTAEAVLDRDVTGTVAAPGFCGIVVPKAEDPDAIESYAGARFETLALIETAGGIRAAYDLASADGIARLALGAIDLALDLGAAGDDVGPLIDGVRARLVIDSRAAGAAGPVDSVTVAVNDPGAVTAAARRARSLGMTAKLCIHPRQVAWTHEGFAPSADEIAWARAVVATGRDGGATAVAGTMVDRPVVERALRLLEHAAEAAR